MDELSRLEADVDAELVEVATSADPADADEPGLAPYQTRLQSLHEAIVVVERAGLAD